MDKKDKNSPDIFAGYIPVIHDGLIMAIDRHPNATIGVFNQEIVDSFDYVRKDIRALSPESAERALSGLGRSVEIIGQAALKEALKGNVIMPEDDISRAIKRENPEAKITLEPIFLRWDRDNSSETSAIIPDRTITLSDSDPVVCVLNREKRLSPNWWRHVGALIMNSSGEIVLSSHNSPLPTDYTSLIYSDPRITAKRGESIERSIDIHAEARMIAESCREGVKLENSSIYVTTFPCPNCAKLIAMSGIKTCYYVDGYATLDGLTVLKNFGVEVVKIDTKLETDDPKTMKPYPKSS